MKSTTYTLVTVATITVFAPSREHWSHLVGYWPYLLPLIYPLMRLPRGRGGHRQHQHHDGPDDRKD